MDKKTRFCSRLVGLGLKMGDQMPQLLGKYEMLQRLAQGGMGEVFLARQTGMAGFDRLAILKTLKAELASRPGFIDQFLDEARVAATLNHPNIVSIYEVGQAEGTYFIAMEYIAGVDLARLWVAAAKAKLGLPFHVSVKILHDAALGLHHAHHAKDVRGDRLEVVHRDVSPQNIMVRGDGVTKVVDFGIAKAENRMSHTQVGTVKGKLQYMSPEQVQGERLDGRSDQFSLGVVLWEMCTGKRLFKSKVEVETLNRIMAADVPPPSTVVPAFPEELESVILKMLSRKPQDRFESCGEAAEALAAYLDHSPVEGRVKVSEFVQEVVGSELAKRSADLAKTLESAPVQVPPQVTVRSQGAEVRLDDEAKLHQWILDGKLSRDDECSTDGAAWLRLGDRPDLIHLFHEVDARKALEAAPRNQAATGAYAPSLSDSHMVTMTTPAGAGGVPSESGHPSPTPVTAPRSAHPASHPSQVHPRSYPQTGSHTLGAIPEPHPQTFQAPASWQTQGHDDALDFPPRRSRAGAIFIAFLVLVVVSAGGYYLVAPEKVEALFLGQGAAEVAAIPRVIATDDRSKIENELQGVQKRMRSLAGEEKATAAAQAALLHAALSFIDAERARMLSVVAEGETAAKDAGADPAAALKEARASAQEHRVATYRLAGETRALDPESTLAQLAMAAYQATRGAAEEMRADVAIALKKGAKDTGLANEASTLEALMATEAALDAEAPSAARKSALEKVNALKANHPDDIRLGYASIALQAANANALEKKGEQARQNALSEVEKFLLESPQHQRAKWLRSSLAPRKAEKVEKVDPFEGKSFDDLMAAAGRAAKAGRSRTASAAYRAALKKRPRSVPALVGLGWASIDRGRNRSAVRLFEKALDYDAGFAEAHFGLAEARRYDGQKARAIASYKRYLELSPSGPDANVAKNAIRSLSE